MSFAAVGVGLGTAAIGAGGSLAAANNAPRPIGPRKIARSTVQGRDLYGGRAYAQDYEDALRYGALDSLLASAGLFGREAGPTSISYRAQVPGGHGRFKTVTRTIDMPAIEGLLPMIRRAQPEIAAAQREGDTAGYLLLDSLTADAQGMVGQYDPYEDYRTQQALRAAQSARGAGYGQSDVLNEILGLELNRQQNRMARGAYAANVLGARRSYMGDPTANAVRYLGAGQSLTGRAPRTNIFNQTVADSLQNQYAGQLANFNSMTNNIASSLAGGANLGYSVWNANQGGIGPGGRYYSDPFAMASLPR